VPVWFEENNTATPNDSEQRSLQKWNALLYASVGNVATCYPEGARPLPSDDEERSTRKINALLGGSSGGGGGTLPGTPTLSGVVDGGLARLTITNGSPAAVDPPYDWEIEGSPDSISWFVIGHATPASPTTETAVALIFGPNFRVRWRDYNLITYGSYSNIVSL